MIQNINWTQNATLVACGYNGVNVHLFEVMDAGEYVYCGRIELVDKQVISVRRPSASVVRLTAQGISSSKLGQPHPASNLSCERYNGAPHWRQR